MRVLTVEDEPDLAEAIRDGLRLVPIASDIAGDVALTRKQFAVLDVLASAEDLGDPIDTGPADDRGAGRG